MINHLRHVLCLAVAVIHIIVVVAVSRFIVDVVKKIYPQSDNRHFGKKKKKQKQHSKNHFSHKPSQPVRSSSSNSRKFGLQQNTVGATVCSAETQREDDDEENKQLLYNERSVYRHHRKQFMSSPIAVLLG